MRLTGTLWKLRARLTVVMLPAARLDATLVKNRKVIGSIGLLSGLGQHQPEELADRRGPAGSSRRRGPEGRPGDDPDEPACRHAGRAQDRADGRGLDADAVGQRDASR